MTATTAQALCHRLDRRRRDLRMSYAALAKRSGVSMPTVVRTLSGRNAQVSLQNVAAISEALGMAIEVVPTTDIDDLRERQARRKARLLVSMAQATSGLESQAVDDDLLRRMEDRTVHELLARSPRRLWRE